MAPINEDDNLDDTVIQADPNKEMMTMIENMKKQMAEMSLSLDAEKKERERLTSLLGEKSSSNTPEVTKPSDHPAGNSFSESIQSSSYQSPLDPNAESFQHKFPDSNTIPIFHGARKHIIDLPHFSGKPEEWPTFLVAYNESSSYMKYSNWENHSRLVKSLHGEAKESVTALLIHPKNVDKVISELERQYGKPEQLLRSQMKTVQNIQPIPENRPEMYIPFATKVRNLAAFLETIDSLPYLANPNLIQDLVMKLPISRRMDWGAYSKNIKPYVTVRDFSDWITELAQIASAISASDGSETPSEQPSGKKKPRCVHHTTSTHTTSTPRSVPSCIVPSCDKENHRIADCPEFIKKDVNSRWDLVKASRVCFSCLRLFHQIKDCRSKKPCGIDGCTKIHHNLLHEVDQREARLLHAISDSPGASSENMDVWFKIVPVKLYHNDRTIVTYAMIDEGASVTLVDDTILKELEMKGSASNLTLQWFGNKTTTNSSQTVDLQISGVEENANRFVLRNVRSVKNINLPTQTVSINNLPREQRMVKKLPIVEYHNAKPMILIGLDNHFAGVPIETVSTESGYGPIAVKTKIGWVVYGSVPEVTNANSTRHHIHLTSKKYDDRLDKIMDEYFTVEHFGVKAVPEAESNDDLRSNYLLKSTTTKVDGRYQSGLLWKNANTSLPNNFDMAKSRLTVIENKMKRDKAYKDAYLEAMDNLVSKGFARKLNPDEANIKTEKTWYLPHFLTNNVNKPGKWRLVFDAAAKSEGVSLNDCLLKGPDFYTPLLKILFNFRMRSIAVSADIKEMFTQVIIQPSDRHAQQFLWRGGDQSKSVDVYVMERMTFGITCSPATAHYVKNTNAKQFIESHPKAVKSIIEHHYVDDFVDSFDNVNEAKEISSAVKMIHREAGFDLRGFLSNSVEVKTFLNSSSDSATAKTMNLDASATEKVLGMYWDTQDDTFKFHLQFNRIKKEVINGSSRPTKRELLSIVMSVFDPYGFLANFTIHAKIIMQQLWRLNIAWDEPIPDEINRMWIYWRNELEKVREFKIPRHYFAGMCSTSEIQLHTFVDASQDSFSAVVYLRVCDGQRFHVRLVAGKTRCSPIKKLLSIPRLELQSAVLGVRLCSSVMENHELSISQKFFWSDSSTVVNWIRSDHRRYKPFVAHRVSEILDSTKTSEWQWISTKLNAADEATRAKFPPKYDPESQWKQGPSFLREHQDLWPTGVLNRSKADDDEELRSKYVCTAVEFHNPIDFSRFSSYTRLKRTVGWIFRFLNNKLMPTKRRTGELSVDELKHAEVIICRLVQRESYPQEITDLSTKSSISPRSHIVKLSPMLDPEGVLRINGRIRRCTAVSLETKQPIIMPKNHIVSKLIVKSCHVNMRHQNNLAIVTEIRQKFWIPDLKTVVKKIRSSCVDCKILASKPTPPMMGELPFDRLSAFVRPFTYCGVDYFGPYQVTIGRRREKRWVALFTCMTIRAVHLEVAADLSTDSCLVCIRNFANRRGRPIKIRSDNGTNFVGASKELNEALGSINQDQMKSSLAVMNIAWEFNCPENPHAGGAWERLVKAVKEILHYTLNEEAPRVEVFQSALIEAECLVNSRPLTEVPLNHEEDEPITPNHFLIGTMNSTQTTGGEVEQKLWCLKKQWRIAQELKNRLWRKWTREYLPSIITRSKWHSKANPIKVGDLVMICERDLMKKKLCRGLVVKVFTGEDGQVRSAIVKTGTGELKRPATKLAVLEVDSESRPLIQDQSDRFTGGGVKSGNTDVNHSAH